MRKLYLSTILLGTMTAGAMSAWASAKEGNYGPEDYIYTLMTDGVAADSKRMIVTE